MVHNSKNAGKQYILLTNVVGNSATDAEIDLYAESWKLPYSIDDSDLTFDGKPLNMLFEENRWMAEHHQVVQPEGFESRDRLSRKQKKPRKITRGRSRQSRQNKQWLRILTLGNFIFGVIVSRIAFYVAILSRHHSQVW